MSKRVGSIRMMDGKIDLTTALLLKACPPRDGSAEEFLKNELGYTDSRIKEAIPDAKLPESL